MAVPVPALVTWWWIFWLAGDVGNVRVNGSTPDAFLVLSSAATTIAGVLVIRVIRQLSARQDHKHEMITSGQLA